MSAASFKYWFALIGAIMLLVGLGSCTHARSFVRRAAHTEGTVIRLEPVYSSSTDNGSHMPNYRPIVRFEYQGRSIVFASQTASNPPSYSEGQTVPVLFLEYDPSTAKIDSFFSLYGFAAIALGMGTIFFGIGAGLILFNTKTQQTDERLRHEGMPITTDFQTVTMSGIEVNGHHPFRVVTRWQDPATSRIRTFESHNVWFDPAQYLKQKQITVYVDRNDPQKYYMDLSFLPKPAGA